MRFCLVFFVGLFSCLNSFPAWGAGEPYPALCNPSLNIPSWVQKPGILSRSEIIALFNYTLGDFETLNPALEGRGSLTECQSSQIRILDGALRKIPPYRGLVYRGTSLRHFSAVPGQEVLLKAYSSTTKDREIAEYFIRGRLLIIHTKTGRPIAPYSNAPNEDEVLLPRNTRLLVRSVEMREMELFSEEKGPYRDTVQIVTADEL